MPSFQSPLLLLTISSWVGIMMTNTQTHAFVVMTPSSSSTAARSSSTRLYIEKHIADMIDQELWREQHRKEFEEEWMKKNRGAIFQSMNKGDDVGTSGESAVGGGGRASNLMLSDDPAEEYRQLRKDRILAANDPMRYCADRCVSTGSCEVFEDIFDFTPEEVIKFCTDCVLSSGEEPCELPESFFDMLEDGPDQMKL